MKFPDNGFIIFRLDDQREYYFANQAGVQTEVLEHMRLVMVSRGGTVEAVFNLDHLQYWHWKPDPPKWANLTENKPELEEPKDE